MGNRDLKDYIVKLNDRNIQRQRESGFTLYAIAAAIIYCIFFMIDNITIAYDLKEPANLAVCVFTANLFFVISLFHIAYLSTVNHTYVSKIFPYQEPLSFDLGDVSLILTFTLISAINFYAMDCGFEGAQLVFLCIFAIIPLLNAISPIAITIYKAIRRVRRKRKKISSDAIDFTFNYNIVKKLGMGIAIYAILLLGLFIYTWIRTSFNIYPDDAGSIIKFTTCFFSLLYLLNLAMDIHNKQNYNHHLEEFEKEIFFEDLDNEEIAKRSESMFFGTPIKKWLSNKEQEIIAFFDERRKASLLESVRIVSMAQMNSQNEINSISETIQQGQKDSMATAKDYIQRINRNFNDLNDYAHLDDDEDRQLKEILVMLNTKIKDFNKEYQQQLNALQVQLNNFISRKNQH